MKKKIVSVLLSMTMVAAILAGCGSTAADTAAPAADAAAPAADEAAPAADEAAPAADTAAADTAAPAASGAGKKVAVAMPTQSSERWMHDGANMKEQLEKLGYEVDLQYAEDDVQAQVSQIENMIAAGANCLVIAAIDSDALVNVEAQAKDAGIPVIAYDRLLMNTDAVSYYATFDNKGVGTKIGEYIVQHCGATKDDPKTIELFMGSPDDNNAHMLYAGLMEQIQPLLDDGSLICKSGQIAFEDNNTLRWDQQTAMKRCEDLLTRYYADEDLDICACAYDGLSYGCMSALEGAGYTDANWPLITGQDAELMATKHIISGKQTMSIYKDTRLLASKCVTMVQAVLEGAEPEINDTEQYNNGKIVVPSYLCEPVPVDKDNYKEVIIGGGYYTEEQLAE
ncbi:MAG: sugar-binding protein [Lachnospiraceae bacterium]|nr:sugar-binding protein [Lachnospiraceae bacterium]